MELRHYAQQQLKRLQRNLQQVMSAGSVEAVHQARVASRRLTEPLELCQPEAGDKSVQRIVKRIKRIRGLLRSMRELDVLQASLARLDVSRSGEDLTRTDIQALTADLSKRRELAWGKAKRKLMKIDRDAIEQDVNCLFDDLESTKGYQPSIIQARLTGLIKTRAKQAVEIGVNREGDADLHPRRLLLKRLRYSLELNLALIDEKRDDLIGRFKAVQDRLGDWNDQLVAVDRLSRIARQRVVMMERPELAMHLLKHAINRLRHSRELADAFRVEWPAFLKCLSELAAD